MEKFGERTAIETNEAEQALPLLTLIEDPSLCAEQASFVRGEKIYAHDSPATHLFFAASGQIRFYQRGPADSRRLVGVQGPNEWFGIAVLAGEPTYGIEAVAFAPSTVWKIPVDRLLAGLISKPQVLAAINRDMARCVMRMRQETTRLIFEDCNQRLISALIHLADSAASTPREDGVVLHMTHSQLAEAVGAARETVSLGLTQLRNRNLLRTGRSQLFFKPEDLRRFRLQ